MNSRPQGSPVLDCGGRKLDLATPGVMGIINMTPDSFSDGGILYSDGCIKYDAVLRTAQAMCDAGAVVLDVGGESTRPGAVEVSRDEECGRVLPVIEKLATEMPAVISVDTSCPQVMREAVAAGAGMINDVRALTRKGAIEVAVTAGVPVCLMHMQGQPATMQSNPQYLDVMGEVRDYLCGRVADCISAGIPREHLLLDPGFGFGKNDAHNLELIRHLDILAAEGFPIVLGISRKSTVGRLLGRKPDERLAGTLALTVIALQRGARLIRTHDVKATVDAIKMAVVASLH